MEHTRTSIPPPINYYYVLSGIQQPWRCTLAISVFGSIGNFVKKSMSAGSSAASALDYGMKTLESQAFMYNIKAQSDALKDKDALALLNNYMLSEDDSENIRKFVTAAKLQQQQQVQTTNQSTISTSTLIRR